jgi:hypothetical protein
MAEEQVPHGQLSRADAILEEIKESSLAQEAQLIRQWEATNLANKLTLDMASKDDIEREYGQQQQGQEVAFSRWSQLYQEKSKDQLIELNLEPSKKGGVASEETSDESKGLLFDLKEKAALSLKNQITENLTKAKRWIDDKASFGNFVGTFKNDINLMTGKLQMLTAIPGVTTAIQGLKLIFANFLKLLGFFIFTQFPKLWKPVLAMVNAFRKAAGLETKETIFGFKPEEKVKKVEDPGEWKVGGTGAEWKEFQKQKEMFEAQEATKGYWGSFKSGFQKMGKSMGEGFKSFRERLGDFWDKAKGLFKKDGAISKGFSKMSESFKGWLKEVNESGGMFKYLGGMLKKAGKAITGAVTRFATWAITGLVSAFTAAALTLGIPVLALVAIVAALVIAGLLAWYFVDEITAWFKDMGAEIKSWGPKIKKRIKELGEDIVYYWNYFINWIKDSFFSYINGWITAINFLLPKRLEIEPLDTGRVEAMEEGRAKQLELRNPATAQKALDVAEDSKELTTQLDNVRTLRPTVPVVTTVNNSTTRMHYTGSPKPRDEILRIANSNL